MQRPPLPPRPDTVPTPTERPSRWLVAALAVALVASIVGLCVAPHHKPRPTSSTSSTVPARPTSAPADTGWHCTYNV